MTRKKTDIAKLTEELMASEQIEGVADLQSVLKEMLKQGVEALLEAETDELLGYERYQSDTEKENYRNGKTTKRVRTDIGEIDIATPRDRNGRFEPQPPPKNSKDLSAMKDKVISMYGRGMTQRDISDHIYKILGLLAFERYRKYHYIHLLLSFLSLQITQLHTYTVALYTLNIYKTLVY